MSRIATLNRFLRRAGVTLVPDWRMDALPLEQHLGRLLKTYDITCVLDVGANLGQFHDLIARQVGWPGPVISFEPVRGYFDVIQRRAAGNPSWRVCNYALGDESAVREIAVFDSPGLATMKTPDMRAMERLLPRHSVNVIARESIRVRRLSEVFEEVTEGLDASRVLLKVDTQGYDLEVFRGARAVLPRICLLQVELSFLRVSQDMPDVTEVVQEIRDAGFDVSGMFPVTFDDAHRAIDLDCVFVSRRRAQEAGLLQGPRLRGAWQAFQPGPGTRPVEGS